jgi:predicted ribosomally synthesized peptide with nif11-like leader
MTEEAIKSFVEKLSTDEEFANKLASAPTPEERLKIANDAGFAISASDVDGIKAALNIEELSDEDLEKVAGGMAENASAVISGTVTAGVSGVTGAVTVSATIAAASFL